MVMIRNVELIRRMRNIIITLRTYFKMKKLWRK